MKSSMVRWVVVEPRILTASLLSALVWAGGLHGASAGVNVWTTSGPEGGPIRALAIDPRSPATLYASVGIAGVFKSTDGSRTWTAANAGLTLLSISDLVISPSTPSTVYAGTSGSGAFKSADAGETWSAIGPTVNGPYVDVVAVDPVVPTTVYVAIRSWLMKSTDGGATWTLGGGAVEYVSDLVIDPVVPSTIYVAGARYTPSGGGLFKSVDGGVTWSPVSSELVDPSGRRYDVYAVAIDPSDTSTLYISTAPGIFKRIGGVWTQLSGRLDDAYVFDLAIDPVTTSTIYASAGGRGVFKSTDGGGSWSALNQGLAGHTAGELAIDPQTPNLVYVATEAGVFSIQQEAFPENGAPLADAGPDQIVEATGPDGSDVTLDASASTDPEGDPLTFSWSWSSGSASGIRPVVRQPLGVTTVSLVVSDPQGATGTDGVQITVRDTTPPDVALTAPEDSATVSGTINVSADAADAVGVAGVQFLLDGEPLGPDDTSAPREVPWDTRTASDGTHELSARGRDGAGNVMTSTTVTVTVANGPIPTLSITRSEESAATLAPSGAWTETTNEDVGVKLSGSRAVYASGAGATATFTFVGTGARWLGFPCERCGVAELFIDGARVATIDTYFPGRPEFWQVMYTSPRLAAGSHTLVIEVTGTSNTASAGAFVVVDAFEATLDGSGILAPISTAPSDFPSLGPLAPRSP